MGFKMDKKDLRQLLTVINYGIMSINCDRGRFKEQFELDIAVKSHLKKLGFKENEFGYWYLPDDPHNKKLGGAW